MYVKKGEVRKVGVEVTNRLNQDFIIDAADFSILAEDGTEIEKGYPTIDGHKVIALFSGSTLGKFTCEFTMHIGVEILKSKIEIEVL
jgi:hypothetical protein